MKKIIEENAKEIENVQQQDLGMSPYMTHVSTVNLLKMEINHALSHLKSWMEKETRETPLVFFPCKVYKLYQPLGPTLIIGSWNYPFITLFPGLISAISAGNPCIIKPSESSVKSSE